MSDEVPNLKAHGVLSWLPVLLAIASPIVSLTWLAAQYPSRAEHNELVLRMTRLEIEVARQGVNSESSRAATERTEVDLHELRTQVTSFLQGQARRR